jgi:hypothetical protein
MKKLHERLYDSAMKTLHERQLGAEIRRQSQEAKERYRDALREEHLRTEIRHQSAQHTEADSRRLRLYNLGPFEYQSLLAQQNGVCAICREPETVDNGRELSIDHDHKTGRVRALLCHRCNVAIGFLRESPLLARAAATYLEQQLTKEFTGE